MGGEPDPRRMRETNTDVWNLSMRKQTTHARDAAASRPRRIVVYVSMIRRRSRVPSRWRSSRSLVAPRFPSRRGGGLHAGDSRGLDAATAAHAVCVYLHGVHVSRGDADGESAEGDDEDGEAEEEPDVDTPEWALFVLGRLTLVVLLGLLDSALALALQRAAHRETTLETARCRYGRRNRYPRGWGNRGRGNATRARL